MTTVLLDQERRWECPNCDYTRVTHGAGQQVVIHNCAGLRGLIAPLVPAGTKCRVVAREREDYAVNDTPQTDDSGRAVMSVVTIREDGQDCLILAPLVGSNAEALYGVG